MRSSEVEENPRKRMLEGLPRFILLFRDSLSALD
jgi:hypothetical protein